MLDSVGPLNFGIRGLASKSKPSASRDTGAAPAAVESGGRVCDSDPLAWRPSPLPFS